MSLPWVLLEVFFMNLWILVDLVPGVYYKVESVEHLSREDVFLLRDEQSPKCFTRTGQDFTCFFETVDSDKTYDLFYTVDGKKRCDLHVQRTDEDTFLHVCSFPASNIFFYVDIDLWVVERSTNSSVHRRTVSMEDHFLLDPPFAVSLQPTEAGQLQVSWRSKLPIYFQDDVKYKIRYSSRSLGETTVEVQEGGTLDSLPPGELVQVQVAVKCASGHWSGWSRPVAAVVPQHADDISLMCFTSDLQSFSCQWNGSRYGSDKEFKLYYRTDGSKNVSRAEWTECIADMNATNLCRFPGDKSRKFRVKLGSSSAPLSRTFFTDWFFLNRSIKTSPPSHLRGALDNEKLCLKWDAPPPPLAARLQYEVGYQVTGGEAWMTSSLQASEPSTCVEVPRGRYSVRIRAKPTGSIYSGYWSDWSDVFTGEATTDTGLLLVLCVPVVLLIIAVVLISLFPSYLSKLKLLLWPPLPNLDKVLEGFLTEMDGQRWNPPLTVKQCPEEATSSVVVVVMPEDEVSGLGMPAEGATTQLLSTESSFSSRDQVRGHPGSELFLDYVTLNKDSVALDPDGGVFVDGYEEGLTLEDELLQTCCSSCSDGSVRSPSCSSTDFLNQSYLALAESVDGCSVPALRGPGNLYTNLPGS